jgi:hypothetical protein
MTPSGIEITEIAAHIPPPARKDNYENIKGNVGILS